jgi:hypothetical protein
MRQDCDRRRSRIAAIGSVLLALADAASFCPAAAQSADTNTAPSLTVLRYEEDYSYLRDTAKRTGAWWEPFKYIPLDATGSNYLSLGVDLRLRQEAYWNFNWGEVSNDEYQWYRALPYADLRLGSNVRLFGQVIAAWAASKHTPVTGVDETGVELLQGFAEFNVPLGDSSALGVRGGRQLLLYGSERLISPRYGPNVLRSFDAGVASVDAHPWRVDAFYARPVRNKIGSFNDRYDTDRSVWSVYATRSLDVVSPVSGLDLYYIGYRNSLAEFNQGAGKEHRHTLGSRLFGATKGWDWNFEAMFQFGRFDGGDIRAWSVASDTGYTFESMPFIPRIGLRANIISGDHDPRDSDLETFNPLFPKGKYFGEIGLIGPSNLINLHPSLALHLGEQWTLQGSSVLYWRESLDDGIYDLGGNVARPSDGSRSRYIGTQADLVLAWEPLRWFSAELDCSVFIPGQFIADTGPSKTVYFIGVEAVVKF